MDGFTIISSCFFALTLAVTFALIIQIHFGLPQVTPHGAVATDDQQCSEIGVDILKDGGNSIDAVIASLLCLSVTHPHIVGPGGGGILLLHDHKKNISKAYDFMTSIPKGLLHTSDTYSSNDGRNIGIPGFVKGIEKIHNLHGILSWKKLFQPVISLARLLMRSVLRQELNFSNEICELYDLERNVCNLKTQAMDLDLTIKNLENKSMLRFESLVKRCINVEKEHGFVYEEIPQQPASAPVPPTSTISITPIAQGQNSVVSPELAGYRSIGTASKPISMKRHCSSPSKSPKKHKKKQGFPISKQLADELGNSRVAKFSSDFKNTFFHKGVVPVSGSVITRNNFAQFLEDLSNGGSDELYLLKYGVEIIEALKSAGSNISVHDLQNYDIKERELLTKNIFNKTIMTVGPPFGGLQVVEGINLLEHLAIDSVSSEGDLYDSFARGLLFDANYVSDAFTTGLNNLENSTFGGSEKFSVREDKTFERLGSSVVENPSAQVSAIDTHDLYVTAVVGLGSSFGSGVSTKHEIILNNHLSFLPHHIHKEGAPHLEFERAITSYTPLITLDMNNKCGRRVVLSSGSTSAMFQVVGQLLFRNLDMTPSIVEPRIVLGKDPKSLLLDDLDSEGKKLSTKVREYLKKQNFTLSPLYESFAVNGVSKFGDTVTSHSDTRFGGIAARIDANFEA